MDKIYGFKKQDVENLIKFLDKRSGQPLTKVFERYATLYGKSKGTVRNMYYALARKSREDQEFAQKYLGGKPISVQKIAEFNAEEEKTLIKRVLAGKKQGKSARAVINEMSLGDGKLALRYQNKYRNALKNKNGLFLQLVTELGEDKRIAELPKSTVDLRIKVLQSEINGLVERLTGKLKKENEYLRNCLIKLERENNRLKDALYGDGKIAADFFSGSKNDKILS